MVFNLFGQARRNFREGRYLLGEFGPLGDNFNRNLDELVSRLSADEFRIIGKAWSLSKELHSDHKRDSGEPYDKVHLIGVLQETIEYMDEYESATGQRIDGNFVAAVLGHEWLEMTDYTADKIERNFNSTVRILIEGVSERMYDEKGDVHDRVARKLSKHKTIKEFSEKDPRVIYLALVDRLHNMKTLGHKPSIKDQERISFEAEEFYKCLAEELGLERLPKKLSELAKDYYPKGQSHINELKKLYAQDEPYFSIVSSVA